MCGLDDRDFGNARDGHDPNAPSGRRATDATADDDARWPRGIGNGQPSGVSHPPPPVQQHRSRVAWRDGPADRGTRGNRQPPLVTVASDCRIVSRCARPMKCRTNHSRQVVRRPQPRDVSSGKPDPSCSRVGRRSSSWVRATPTIPSAVRGSVVSFDAVMRGPHVRPMDFTGKPLRGFVYVSPRGFRTATALCTWLSRGERVAQAKAVGTKTHTRPRTAGSTVHSQRSVSKARANRR